MAKRTIGSTISIVAVEDSSSYRIDLSSSVVRFKKDGSLEPSSIRADLYEVKPDEDVLKKSAYWVMKDAGGTTIFDTPIPITFGRLTEEELRSAIYPIQINVYANKDGYPIAQASVTKVEDGADGNDGAEGKTGKMGRNFYYLGEWSSVYSFTVNDYQAPYVMVSDGIFYIFVGSSGNYTKYTSVSDTGNITTSKNWAKMTSEHKFIISQAIFSEFAKLGSGIFNLDFLFSQHGELVTKGESIPSQNYKFVDPSDMGATQFDDAPLTIKSLTITDAGSWSEANRYGAPFRLKANKNYLFKATSASSTPAYFKIGADFESAIPESGVSLIGQGASATYFFSTAGVEQDYYLYYSNPPSAESVIKDIAIEECKFRPNVYVDWLKGFIYAQTGKFKDIIIEGVMNNLITDIHATSDRLIKYSWTDSSNNTITEYCLDVLRCGNVVRIKSLPADIKGTDSTNSYLNLPYFITDDDAAQKRTHTRLNADGSVASTSRPVTADEMRMLVGRKLCLIMDFEDASFCKTFLPAFRAIPNALANENQSSGSLANAIVEVANGNPHVYDVTPNNLISSDIALGIKQTIWIECKMIRNVDNNQAIYIWTSSYTSDDGGHTEDDYLDDAWG